jgi:hypothetical protein
MLACRNAQVVSIPMGTDSEIRMVFMEAFGALSSSTGMQPAEERFHEDQEQQGRQAVALERSSVNVHYRGEPCWQDETSFLLRSKDP